MKAVLSSSLKNPTLRPAISLIEPSTACRARTCDREIDTALRAAAFRLIVKECPLTTDTLMKPVSPALRNMVAARLIASLKVPSVISLAKSADLAADSAESVPTALDLARTSGPRINKTPDIAPTGIALAKVRSLVEFSVTVESSPRARIFWDDLDGSGNALVSSAIPRLIAIRRFKDSPDRAPLGAFRANTPDRIKAWVDRVESAAPRRLAYRRPGASAESIVFVGLREKTPALRARVSADKVILAAARGNPASRAAVSPERVVFAGPRENTPERDITSEESVVLEGPRVNPLIRAA